MIRINKVRLINFMCCSSVNLDFTDRDIVVLSGKNGQGKSTVFDALAFSFASVKRADKAQEYVKLGESSSSVYVNATFNDEIIEITTEINVAKNKSNIEKTVSYKGRVYKNSEANNILKTLKMDFYTSILFSMQDGEKISDMTPSVRSEYLKNVMNINFLDEVSFLNNEIKTLSEKCSKASTEKLLLEKQLNENTEEIQRLSNSIKEYPYSEETYYSYKEDLKVVSEELVRLGDDSTSREVEEYNATIKEQEALLSNIKREIDENNLHKKENEESLKKKKEYSDKIAELEGKVNEIINEDDLEKYKAHANEIVEKIKDIDTEINELQYSLRDKRKYVGMSLQDKESEYSILKSELKSIPTNREELVSDIKNKEESCIINNQKIKELESQIDELKDKDRCPTCKQLVPEDLIDIFKDRLEETRKTSESLKNDLKNSNDYLEKYDKYIELKNDIEVLREVQITKSKVSELNSTKETLSTENEEIQKKISDMDSKKFERKSIIDKIDFYKNELKGLKFWEEKNTDEKEAELLKINSQISELKDKVYKIISENNAKVSNLVKQQKQLQEEIGKRDKIQQENDTLIHTKSLLEEKVASLSEQIGEISESLSSDNNKSSKYALALNIFSKDLPNHILLYVSRTLQNMMNQMMGRIMSNLKCKLLKEKLGVEFFYAFTDKDIESMDKNELLSVKMASGFEKSLLTIVFKLALCKIYGLGFALLDEIDCYSDDENSENLFNMILESGITEQVFIITHKPYTKNSLQNFSNKSVIYSVKKGNFVEME